MELLHVQKHLVRVDVMMEMRVLMEINAVKVNVVAHRLVVHRVRV